MGSGVNDARPQLLKWLTDPMITLIVVEPKDRLTRFGFNPMEPLLARQGRAMEVVHLADVSSALSAGNGTEDLIQDFVTLRRRHFFLRPAVRPTTLEAHSQKRRRTDHCGVAKR